MKLDEKHHVLNVLNQLLHDNTGNRLTPVLIRGLFVAMSENIPAEPPPEMSMPGGIMPCVAEEVSNG